jgi:hypothetical protein
MRIKINRIKHQTNGTMVLFFGSMVLSVLVLLIWGSHLLSENDLMGAQNLWRLSQHTVDKGALFCFLLVNRMGVFLFLAIAATTYLGKIAWTCSLAWYGASAGAFFASCLLRYGLKGILLSVVSLFPQYLFYVPAYLALMHWSGAVFSTFAGRFGGGSLKQFDGLKHFLPKLFPIFLLLVAGCAAESLLNAPILLAFLKIF